MFFFHHPYAVNHLPILEHTEKSLSSSEQCSLVVKWITLTHSSSCAHLVIRHLLHVQVGSIDHLHTAVAVVCAAESTPLFGVWIELVSLLSAALQKIHQELHRAFKIGATCLLQTLSTKSCLTFTTVAVPRCESVCILISQWLIPLWLDDKVCSALFTTTSEKS